MTAKQMPKFDLVKKVVASALLAISVIGVMVAPYMPNPMVPSIPWLVTDSCLPGMPQVEHLYSMTTAVPPCWLVK